MKKIDQFVHTLHYGDAISGEAITIKRILTEMGFESNIYALHTHPRLTDLSKKMEEFERDRQPDGLILHYSISSPQNAVYTESKCPHKFLVYHNLTPAHWFQGYNGRVYEDLVKGLSELPALINQTHFCIADSKFNASELEKFSPSSLEVLPLLIDPARWECRPNPGIVSALKASGGRNILHVGRIAPNKQIEHIIKAFYFYHHKLDKNSRLWLVGHDIDTEIYSFELRKLISDLMLSDVVEFAGSVSDDELLGFYTASDAYICMSGHEGFCVPIIEAMHHSLPVVAYNSSAIGETIGSAGILLNELNPLKTAIALNEVIFTPEIRSSLITAGHAQVEQFSLSHFKENLSQLIVEKIVSSK